MGPAIVARLEGLGAVGVSWDLHPGSGNCIACDVGDAASVERAMEETVQQWGIPTVLVNLAGVSPKTSPLAVSASDDEWPEVLTAPDVWHQVLTTNVIGAANCMRSFARRIAHEERPGAIVNVSSIASGPIARAGRAAYGASKAALNQLTRIAAVDLGPLGIRVNCVAPGMVQERMLGPTRPSADATGAEVPPAPPSAARLAMVEQIPIEQREGTGNDIAEAICAVLQMDWVTGQTIFVDGGGTLRGSYSA
jgi:NAD(P)-dependent dehydrogenase (short-subunit alcohol dehydrogenase family)